MKINFSDIAAKADAIVVGVYDDGTLTSAAKTLNSETNNQLTKAIAANNFKGTPGKVLTVTAPGIPDTNHILICGLGTNGKLTEINMNLIGAGIVGALLTTNSKSVEVRLNDVIGELLNTERTAVAIATGCALRAFTFDQYKTKKKNNDQPNLTEITFVVPDSSDAHAKYTDAQATVEGVRLARTLGNEPPNILYPESFAKRIKELKKLGVKVEVLNERKMRSLGMGALLGVGQGSSRESQMVVMEWFGAKSKKTAPLAFVGKGVTFDTGGISIKPSAKMDEMKFDMCGAAAVVGTIHALAARRAKVNAVGVVGLVENMPDGNAQRPGDIVTSMSGQTIEVLNTDAEGRLVLADALWYTQNRFNPKAMIDLATLTGAMVVSLGAEHAGIMSNDSDLAQKLHLAGLQVDEKLWRLPLHEAYDKMIDSDVADMKNISGGNGAGSITAAQFLQRFVNNVPWVHIDIAGTVWSSSTPHPIYGKGCNGFGVRLLDRFVAENYEDAS
jgi:leucyl aminopeptidase